jgi:hypothetical protein
MVLLNNPPTVAMLVLYFYVDFGLDVLGDQLYLCLSFFLLNICHFVVFKGVEVLCLDVVTQ